jgi:hypothetical protein
MGGGKKIYHGLTFFMLETYGISRVFECKNHRAFAFAAVEEGCHADPMLVR